MIVNDACTIVQASFTIVTYDRQNIFIIQATEEFNADKLLCQMNNLKEQLALGHWLFTSSAPMITITTLFMVGCLVSERSIATWAAPAMSLALAYLPSSAPLLILAFKKLKLLEEIPLQHIFFSNVSFNPHP